MKPNKYLVYAVRNFWLWFWRKLMDGFAPSDKDGNYKRPKGFNFDKNFKIDLKDNESLYLLLGETCPWCHRAVLVTELKKLSKIKKIYLRPNLKNGEWIFKNNFFENKTLTDLYKRANKGKFLRATVPLLLKSNNTKVEVISNESSEIIEILNSLNCKEENLIKIEQCEKEILNLIHNDINNGVYKCGFARNQVSYVKASNKLFKGLYAIDELIKNSGGHWIFGDKLTYADIYLFPTIIRWELIYSKLFKCTEKEISEYKNILKWRLNFFEIDGISETCFERKWLSEYYKGLFPLNPNQLIPLQPSLKKILQRDVDLLF